MENTLLICGKTTASAIFPVVHGVSTGPAILLPFVVVKNIARVIDRTPLKIWVPSILQVTPFLFGCKEIDLVILKMFQRENTIKVLVTSNLHVGFAEREPLRSSDSISTFQEVLQAAKAEAVDFVLITGTNETQNYQRR